MSRRKFGMTYNVLEVKALYDRIRNLREDADLPQRKLAELLKVTQTTYSRYESGVLDIPTDMLVTLARFYDTSIGYLVGLTDEKTPYPR